MTLAKRSGTGRLEGKVALITGAGGGQGKSHAKRFAEEGASVILTDLARVGLDESAALVQSAGGRSFVAPADVRDARELEAAVSAGYEAFGRLDIVCPNAGVAGSRRQRLWEIEDDDWHTVIDTNLTGVWNTIRAGVPKVIAGGDGGSVLLIGSLSAYGGAARSGQYTASKHGVLGLLKVLANELGEYSIRVNAVHPTFVDTPLAHEPGMYDLFTGTEGATLEQFQEILHHVHILPVGMIEPVDVSNALVWLASDEARYLTGVSIPIDAGAIEKV